MEFLDPKAKRTQGIRLMIGYFLVAILVITLTLILVYRSYGFDVDRKTGEVIQNGLVYIDSAPDGADLYLNGELYRDKTNVRMTLPDGDYDINIKKAEYRDWSRRVNIEGGSVERITYPLLLLQNLAPQQLEDYAKSRPTLTTQSPDRRWLMIAKPGSVSEYTEYDLGNLDEAKVRPASQSLSFPTDLFKVADGPQKIEIIEWSNDNKNFLIKHTFGSGSEFILLNRDEPTASLNINQLLGVTPDEVTLRDKKADQWYLYTKQAGLLQVASSDKTIEPVVNNVVAYKTHDMNTLLYAVKSSETVTTIYLRQNGKTYSLRTVKPGEVLLNIARFDGAWYVAVASDGDKRSYVYKNPATVLAQTNGAKPTTVASFKAEAPITSLLFSTNTRFIMAQNGQNIGVYDAEKDEAYAYTLKDPIDADTEVTWMDGHRIQYRSGGNETIVDFDGSNNQKLVPTVAGDTAFFDRDYTVLYTLSPNPNQPDAFGLYTTNLRLDADK